MELKFVVQVNEMSEKTETSKALAAHIIANDTVLSRRIIQDWLDIVWEHWKKFYGPLSKNILEGYLAGPSPGQVYILKRMRDNGHRIGPIRGMFRWIGGSDERINRRTMRLMLEWGWLHKSDTTIYGLEYILEPTELGKFALANYELDREGRAFP